MRVALGADGWRVVRQTAHRERSRRARRRGARRRVRVRVSAVDQGEHPRRHSVLDEVHDRRQVLVFTVAVAVATGLLFGLAPALQSARPNLNETLRDAGARGSSAGRARQRLRSGLVVGEVALSLVLLVGAALLIRSFLGMQRMKPGFDPSNLLTMRVTLSGPAYDSTYKRLRLLGPLPRAAQRAARHRRPRRSPTTFRSAETTTTTSSTSRASRRKLGTEPLLEIRWVSPRYLETLRVPLRARAHVHAAGMGGQRRGRPRGRHQRVHGAASSGRTPTTRSASGSRSAARPTRRNRWITIVGVAADIKHRQLHVDARTFRGTCRTARADGTAAAIVVRTPGDPTQATADGARRAQADRSARFRRIA